MMARGVRVTGIRARVTGVMVLATALSMAVLTLVVAGGVRQTLAATTKDYLTESIDRAQGLVERGDLEGAIDVSGPVVLQVLDEDGSVLAASEDALDTVPVIDPEPDGTDDVDDLIDEAVEDGVEAVEDARESTAESVDSEDDKAEEAAEAAADAREAESEAREDAAEESGDAYEASDDDDADDDLDQDWDDDAKSMLGLVKRAAWAVARVGYVPPSDDKALLKTAEEIIRDQLGVREPYMIETRQATYQGRRVHLIALASLAQALDAATSALRTLGAASVVVVAAAAALTWYLVGRTLRPVELMRASTLNMVEGDPSGRLEVPEDDRDLRELAATFNDLLERAQQSLVEQRRFVSDASHQLKSPIAAQRAMIETLRTHPAQAELDRTVDDLASENNRLQGIVDDLLALARYDEGQKPVMAPVDLIDVIYDEAASLQMWAPQQVDLSGVEPVVVRGDARLLGQAIRNLLDNAARYARSRIVVTCEERAGEVVVSVCDDGPGIPEADRERIFERFVRLDDGGELSRTSTGLGLAVVRSIVESHGGSVCMGASGLGGAAAQIKLPVV